LVQRARGGVIVARDSPSGHHLSASSRFQNGALASDNPSETPPPQTPWRCAEAVENHHDIFAGVLRTDAMNHGGTTVSGQRDIAPVTCRTISSSAMPG